MSLTNLLRNKTRVLVLGAALTACGDTYNTYAVGENQGPSGKEINNCDDVAARLYECDPQKFKDYEEAWGVSIEEQKSQASRECSPEKVDFFKNAPAWIDCIEQNSCQYINVGNCDQYMVDY
ncbi:MAG: hypothetical protein Q7S55_01675 [Nanoarchaeota archaeon]|nr:hypothetical protein [Nanoarchaeota archaeon]